MTRQMQGSYSSAVLPPDGACKVCFLSTVIPPRSFQMRPAHSVAKLMIKRITLPIGATYPK